jgi:hypothetical protein
MADVTKSFRASELRHRVLELSRKWLPMLLSRVGVEHAATLRIRQGSEDEAVLRGQLQFARVVTVAAAKRSKGGQNEDLSQHALAVIAALERALDLCNRDLDAAERAIDRVNRTLLGLVVGRRPDPREIDAIDRSSTWWSRLLARSGVAGAAY